MANYDNLYDSLDRNDYTLLPNGVISNKYQGLFYKGKLMGTNITKEEMIKSKPSVPEDYWNDYIEMMKYINNDDYTFEQRKAKIKEISSRGRIPEGHFEIDK